MEGGCCALGMPWIQHLPPRVSVQSWGARGFRGTGSVYKSWGKASLTATATVSVSGLRQPGPKALKTSRTQSVSQQWIQHQTHDRVHGAGVYAICSMRH